MNIPSMFGGPQFNGLEITQGVVIGVNKANKLVTKEILPKPFGPLKGKKVQLHRAIV